jgi:HSP20 family protein
MDQQMQNIPVRIYRAPDRLVLAAPMPGLEPQDIRVAIADNRLTINGNERGIRQDERELIVAEWRIGPYFREISLDQAVDGPRINATYGNGILVLSMPLLKEKESSSEAAFWLSPIHATRGERIGHTGSEIRPTSTVEHRKKHEAEAAMAGDKERKKARGMKSS